jgi:hypothetical protein
MLILLYDVDSYDKMDTARIIGTDIPIDQYGRFSKIPGKEVSAF